jgi:ATP-dependent helicase HrpA
MIRDRHRLARAIRALEQGGPGNRGRGKRARRSRGDHRTLSIDQIAGEIERSLAEREARAASVPKVTYPTELPVVERRDDIAKAIADNQVVVLCGETGSGKTTQLPKICLELGRGISGTIGHTQPRRIAARSVSARIASELSVPHGKQIGYKVRFGDQTDQSTLVKLMTDGILLAETQRDRFLNQYDTIIIDEAHERSLNIDFLLGYLRNLLPKRPDLKVIVTSATIDPQRFSEHFNNAPIIEVSGRTYPVEIRYRPFEERDDPYATLSDAIADAVEEVVMEDAMGDGNDVLIFLSGEREIRDAADALRDRNKARLQQMGRTVVDEILPLYARLSPDEQQRVFAPHRGRRAVLATNVAETSLTVPGIKYVIDPGLARISRYSARSRVQRLPIEPISQASADQRKGRCGRIGPGVCVRLYSEDDYAKREPFTPPEILRTSLAGVILQMKALNLGDIERFPFVEPPKSAMVREGYETLHEIGAIDDKDELTPIGRSLARMPIDPRIGRMILAGADEDCLTEVLVIAAALSIQDPRLRPHDKRDQADAAHEQFRHDRSDFLSYLNIWHFYHDKLRELSRRRVKLACEQNFLSNLRMREWQDVHKQLAQFARESGLKQNRKPAEYDAIHRALLTGLLTNVGRKSEKGEYEGVRNRKFRIFPGSGQVASKPDWIMCAEIIETAQVYAHTVARIDPAWVERLGKHLVKRSHTAPRWVEQSQTIIADEKVTLMGLEIIPRRSVNYANIDPKTSRDLFIHHALVQGELRTKGKFLQHNANLIEQVEKLEHKGRRRDLLAEAEARHAFYDARLPAGVASGARFEKWRKEAEERSPRLLYMSIGDVLAGSADDVTEERYPDAIDLGGAKGALEYRFAPGDEDDGVTLNVPAAAALHVSSAQTSWLIPGLVEEKARQLIRALPKMYRRNFDAGLCAREFAESAAHEDLTGAAFTDALSEFLTARTGTPIPRDAWREHEIDAHLRMRLRVLDEKGEEIAAGRDVDSIVSTLGGTVRKALESISDDRWSRDDVTTWDFGELPEEVTIERSGAAVTAYPAVVEADDHQSVSLRLMESKAAAERASRAGTRRLFTLAAATEMKHQAKGLPGFDAMSVRYAPLGPPAEFKKQIVTLIADRAFLSDGPLPRSKQAFERAMDSGWTRLGDARREVCELVAAILNTRHAVAVKLEAKSPPDWAYVVHDVKRQVAQLTPKEFLISTPWSRLRHFPRYFRACEIRLTKLAGGGLERDRRATIEIARHLQRVYELAGQTLSPELDDYRWLVEEMRVSAFAQELRTAVPVSLKRLDQAWDQAR